MNLLTSNGPQQRVHPRRLSSNMLQHNVDVVMLTGGTVMRTAGAYRIATEIRNAGYTCQVVDFISQFEEHEILKVLTSAVGQDTKILGISSTWIGSRSTFIPKNFEVTHAEFNIEKSFITYAIKTAKSINPRIKVVVGGAHALGSTSSLVDVCVSGLGDLAIIEYLEFINGKNPFFQYTKNSTGQMVLDGARCNNQFDFNNSQIKFHPSDNISGKEILPIEISRGCIFKCKFCAFPLNGKKKNDYTKNSNTIKEELLRGYYEYGTTKYWYMDDTHNESIEKLRQMADIVQSLPFKLEYVSYIRPDLLHAHPEQYQLLKDGGLAGCFFGIESLHPPTAKLIGKGLDPSKLVDTLHTFAEKLPHVSTSGGFICGLPLETKESVTRWSEQLLSPGFPLDHVRFFSLKLSKNYTYSYQSEFDKNTDKYFTWIDDNTWFNGNFDHNWAVKFVADFHTAAQQRQMTGGHTLFLMQNIGFPASISKRAMTQQEFSEVESRCWAFVNRYKKSLLS